MPLKGRVHSHHHYIRTEASTWVSVGMDYIQTTAFIRKKVTNTPEILVSHPFGFLWFISAPPVVTDEGKGSSLLQAFSVAAP